MAYESPYGAPEGIGKRLAYWANQLSRSKEYPWVGLGLINDLKCAAKLHGADFDTLYPLEVGGPPPPPPGKPIEVVEDWEKPFVRQEAYDL